MVRVIMTISIKKVKKIQEIGNYLGLLFYMGVAFISLNRNKPDVTHSYFRIVFSFFARLRSVFVSISHLRLSRKVDRPSSVSWK